ncbi:MAG: glycosyltransferase family 2 protein [Bacteroidales bacterium]
MGEKIHSNRLSIVIPAFNEAESLPRLAEEIQMIMKPLAYPVELLLVDDGSSDNTPMVMESLSHSYPNLYYIRLSRNFGHQNALKAGLDHATGQAVIMMDADLQHPPTLLPQLIARWEEGFDIVNTCRLDTSSQSPAKRFTSKLFYRLLNHMCERPLEPGAADFRLISRRVADTLRTLHPSDLFFRGLLPWMGFSTTSIPYQPARRFAGHTKYSLKKMIALAVQGITSFSTKPLSLAVYLGLTLAAATLLYLLYALMQHHTGQTVSGWTSLITLTLFLHGVQLTMTGILGIYLGKLFLQNKQRPPYLIQTAHLPPPLHPPPLHPPPLHPPPLHPPPPQPSPLHSSPLHSSPLHQPPPFPRAAHH